MSSKKIAHLHIEDYSGNKYTLICQHGMSIKYIYYGGWGSSGMPFSISNMQCELPIEPKPGETVDDFVNRLVYTINNDSVVKVVKRVATEVTFAPNK